MSSIATYRGYPHTANEVNLVTVGYKTRYSPRNRRLTETRTMRLEGELIYTDSATIISKAAEVINAYSQDGGDFTYVVGGVTAHSLSSGASLSGVKVIDKSFPSGSPAQLATTRTFHVTLQATYDACEDPIVSWQESIDVTGNGGPIWTVMETVFGPLSLIWAPSSAQYFMQTGRAVGFSDYPSPPPPIASGGEFGQRRRVRKTSGIQQGTGIKFFSTTWTYLFATDPARAGAITTDTPTSK